MPHHAVSVDADIPRFNVVDEDHEDIGLVRLGHFRLPRSTTDDFLMFRIRKKVKAKRSRDAGALVDKRATPIVAFQNYPVGSLTLTTSIA
jgi:hypothetical protein